MLSKIGMVAASAAAVVSGADINAWKQRSVY